MEYFADLHIHSCLSPCGDEDMTPANICGMAKLKGLDAIAICDHNSARNLPAAQELCDAYGLLLLPAWRSPPARRCTCWAILKRWRLRWPLAKCCAGTCPIKRTSPSFSAASW